MKHTDRALLRRKLEDVTRKEQKEITRKQGNALGRMDLALDLVTQKTPQAALDTLYATLEQALWLLIQKGDAVISKLAFEEKRRIRYQESSANLNNRLTRRALWKLERDAAGGAAVNSGVSAAEGTALGLLGIGLIDIPILLGTMLKTVYEIAVGFGYDYKDPLERAYILYVICAAFAQPDSRAQKFAAADMFAYRLDTGATVQVDLKALCKKTAVLLAQRMLAIKAFQGIPVVGAVGGAYNFQMVSRLSKVAFLKYKKRFLMNLERSL